MKAIAWSSFSVARGAVATLVGAVVIVAGLSAPAAAQNSPTGLYAGAEDASMEQFERFLKESADSDAPSEPHDAEGATG